jgi:hypothetical protein
MALWRISFESSSICDEPLAKRESIATPMRADASVGPVARGIVDPRFRVYAVTSTC